MKFEVENGSYVGTIEWEAPGRVALEMDEAAKSWFERYFGAEDSFMGGELGDEFMEMERRDSSEEAFNRAAYQLAAYSYKVRARDGHRQSTVSTP
jgi:hypothetical protein